MKYIKYFENIDPFNEEDWEEEEIDCGDIVSIRGHLNDIHDVPDCINKRIMDIGGGKLGLSNSDYTKVLTVDDSIKSIDYFELFDNKIKSKLIDHNGEPNTKIQYKIKIANTTKWVPCDSKYSRDGKCPVFDYSMFKPGDLIFHYCSPEKPDINNIINYGIIAGLDSASNHSLFLLNWDEENDFEDWGAAKYFKVFK